MRITGNTFSNWSGAGYTTSPCGVEFDVTARNVTIDRNTFNGNGKAGSYGLRVTGSGGSTNGSISNNTFRKAILFSGGVPHSGNVLE